MAVEFIGSFVPAGRRRPGQDAGLSRPGGRARCRGGIRQAADRLLGASAPDGLLVADEVLTTTSRLGAVVAQVPGLVAPTVAARQYATLAAFHQGRVAMHALTGVDAAADAAHQRRDRPVSPGQAAEFLEVVRRSWHARGPFDYRGEFYRVDGAAAPGTQRAGASRSTALASRADALRIGAAHADVYLLATAPASVIARRMAELRNLAASARQVAAHRR